MPGIGFDYVRSHYALYLILGSLWIRPCLTAIAGLIMYPIARLLYLLSSEFPPVVENLLYLTLLLVSRFPNTVPSDTYVPNWALLDPTVCFKAFFYGIVIITRNRKTINGTPAKHVKQAVSISPPGLSSLSAPRYYLTRLV